MGAGTDVAVNPAPEQQRHSWFRIWAELTGAWAIAIARPLFVVIASGPEAMTSYGLRRLDVIALIVLVVLIGPLMISLFELLLRRLAGEQPRRVFHGLAIGALLSIVIWDWMTNHDHTGAIRDLVPLLCAFGFAWFFVRFELVRNFVLIFSVATPVVILSFVTSYPIWSTVGPHESSQAAQQTDSKTPVVMVVFDELPLASLENRQGRIDARHFPTFGEVARTSTWYPGMKGVGDQTTIAVPAMLTGQDPASPDDPAKPTPPGLPDYPNSLCSILDRAGYEVRSYEPVTDLCARSYDFGTRLSGVLGRANQWVDPGFTVNPGYFRDMLVSWFTGHFKRPYNEYESDRSLAVGDFVGRMTDDDRSISVLHIALPHIRWMFQPDGTTYENLRPADDDQLGTPLTRGENERDMQMHLLQLAFADQQLKRVVDRMKELGIWQKSLFVVTADHGTGFQAGGSRRLINFVNAGWILPVPLLIKEPGQDHSRVVNGSVDSRDITPTVLAQLGLKPGDEATGRDLSSLDQLPVREKVEGHGFYGDFSFDRAMVDKELRQARDYRSRLFPGSLYAVGGDQQLLGRRPDGMRKLDFELALPEQYENVDTAGGYVPAWVQGTIVDPGDRPPKRVAVALNGRIVAIAPVWTAYGTTATGVVIPGEDFVDGRNQIAVYEIGSGR